MSGPTAARSPAPTWPTSGHLAKQERDTCALTLAHEVKPDFSFHQNAKPRAEVAQEPRRRGVVVREPRRRARRREELPRRFPAR